MLSKFQSFRLRLRHAACIARLFEARHPFVREVRNQSTMAQDAFLSQASRRSLPHPASSALLIPHGATLNSVDHVSLKHVSSSDALRQDGRMHCLLTTHKTPRVSPTPSHPTRLPLPPDTPILSVFRTRTRHDQIRLPISLVLRVGQ
jgi:hypothetical protein